MAMPGEIDRDTCGECKKPLKLEVLHSPAGHYIGTWCDQDGPNSRESGYFPTHEEAVEALAQWEQGNKVGKRDTEYHPENKMVEIAIPNNVTELMAILDSAVPQADDNPLTVNKLQALLESCLFPEGTTKIEDGLYVIAIVHHYLFDPVRIEEHHEQIKEMLDQLPDTFKEGSEGGGWSFLMMCNRKDGEQWTGLHARQEQLMALGMAAGWATMIPRALWPMLPGGMPYMTILKERQPPPHMGPEEIVEANKALVEKAAQEVTGAQPGAGSQG